MMVKQLPALGAGQMRFELDLTPLNVYNSVLISFVCRYFIHDTLQCSPCMFQCVPYSALSSGEQARNTKFGGHRCRNLGQAFTKQVVKEAWPTCSSCCWDILHLPIDTISPVLQFYIEEEFIYLL